jgi:hypothetical protein
MEWSRWSRVFGIFENDSLYEDAIWNLIALHGLSHRLASRGRIH